MVREMQLVMGDVRDVVIFILLSRSLLSLLQIRISNRKDETHKNNKK